MKLFQIFSKSTQPGPSTKTAPVKAWRGKVYQASPSKTRDATATADLRQVLNQRAPTR
jgi:hypothetical protein